MTRGVVKFDRSFFSSDTQDVTFVWMKSHFPFSFPYCKFVEFLLQMLCIFRRFIAMYTMVSSTNSRIVDIRPTGISFI